MINAISRDRFILFPFIASVLLMLISIFIGFTRFVDTGGKLVINYSSSGAPILGDLGEISSIILIAGTIILINLGLIYTIYYRKRIFAYVLSLTNVLISGLILATLMAISSFN